MLQGNFFLNMLIKTIKNKTPCVFKTDLKIIKRFHLFACINFKLYLA